MDELIAFIKKEGGRIGISSWADTAGADHWTVAVEFGQEEPGSSMAAGASYGQGATLEDAFAQVKAELRL